MTRRAANRGALAGALGTLLPVVAFAQSGTITGKVQATPAKYLEETVVYVKQAPGQFPPKAATMDQRGLKFLPHVLVITRGDTVRFLNHDTVAHNVFSPDHGGYNLGVFKPGEERSRSFDAEGVYNQLCSLHPEMLAFVFVGQNPYAAAVDTAGNFTIKNLPPGEYELAIWNSHLKAEPVKVTVAADKPVTADFNLKR
jgi:plastocyanin